MKLRYPLSFAPGETLLEAIIAITVLMIALTFVGDAFSGSLRGLTFSKKQAVASFLAKEGKEAVKNILLSNELRFSSDLDNCWNAGWTNVDHADGGATPVQNVSDCAANPIGFVDGGWTQIAGNRDNPALYGSSMQYFQLLFYEGTGRFTLEPITASEFLFSYDDAGEFTLNLTRQECDPNPTPCISKNDSADPYAVVETDSGFYEYVKVPVTDPRFWRGIGIVYFNSEPTDEDGAPESLPDSMKVVSVVAFEEGGEFKYAVESF